MWRPSLATQLVALLSLALLPLGLIALTQTYAVAREAEELAARAILVDTQGAASVERETLARAMGAATSLGQAIVVPGGDPEECNERAARAVAGREAFVWAGFTSIDGRVECSSNSATADFSDDPVTMERIRRQVPLYNATMSGVLSGEAVIIASAPIYDGDTHLGVFSVSIPHDLAQSTLSDTEDSVAGLALATITTDGIKLSSSTGLPGVDLILPVDVSPEELVGRIGTTFRGQNVDGEERVFAVASLIDDRVVVVGSLPVELAATLQPVAQGRLALVFPILMWIASLAVVIFGIHRLVTRHVRPLRNGMRRFALGERSDATIELDNAPPELEEVKRAFNRMTVILSDAEARTKKDLMEKTILLREVHHRVKNNLQMIASIMSLQTRQAKTDESKELLGQLQTRVRGLATIHRSLYVSPETSAVSAPDMVEELVHEIGVVGLSDSTDVELTTDVAEMNLYPDQAVPISMFLAEAMSNAIKYVGVPEEGLPFIKIEMSRDTSDRDMVHLMVCNSTGPLVRADDSPGAHSTGLGKKLMRAFAMQLNGATREQQKAAVFCQELTFPLADHRIDP
ncbi:MAG: sensor histidine kinase [Shimia sp.]